MAGGNKEFKMRQKGDILAYPVGAGVHIYRSSMVCVNIRGYAVPGADTAYYRFIGMAEEEIDNTLGCNGAKTIRVRRHGIYRLTLAAAVVGCILNGKWIYLHTGQSATVDQKVYQVTTNSICVGEVVRHEDSTHVYVDIERCWAYGTPAVARVSSASSQEACSSESTESSESSEAASQAALTAASESSASSAAV